MNDVILDDIKLMIGVPVEETNFDPVIAMFIDGTFSTLYDVGVEMNTLSCENGATWESVFVNFKDKNFKNIRTYVFIETKLLFDPPTIGAVMNAMQSKSAETLWRISSNVKLVREEETQDEQDGEDGI